MIISGALSSAVSGMASNARRTQVAADNIANITTPGFIPKEVVTTSVLARARGASGYQAGGVRTFVKPDVALSVASLELSNVDVADEYTRLIQARAAYKASAAVVRTGSEMMREPIIG